MQQRPQLGVLPLQALRLGEELGEVRQRPTGDTGKQRTGPRLGVSLLRAAPVSAAYSLVSLQFVHRRVPQFQLVLGDRLVHALPECPVPRSVLGKTAGMSPGRLFP